ncbi:MAG: hypothetical protein ACYC8T_15095 [Myxococcaceae bacterium]
MLDPPFAADQYRRAKAELSREVLGFAVASEWPRSWRGPSDIDSGLSIPLLDASPSSSGLALVAASTVKDSAYLSQLLASLEYGGFPVEDHGGLRQDLGVITLSPPEGESLERAALARRLEHARSPDAAP